MPHHQRLIIRVFIASAFLHLTLIVLKNRCYQNKNKSSFIHYLVQTGWPYVLSSFFTEYVLPGVLRLIGFGHLGILRHSVAAWIQRIYGTSSIFSFLQSIGARGGVRNPFLSILTSGSILKQLSSWIKGRDLVAECVDFYESLLFWLTIFDLLFIIGYWLFVHQRVNQHDV